MRFYFIFSFFILYFIRFVIYFDAFAYFTERLLWDLLQSSNYHPRSHHYPSTLWEWVGRCYLWAANWYSRWLWYHPSKNLCVSSCWSWKVFFILCEMPWTCNDEMKMIFYLTRGLRTFLITSSSGFTGMEITLWAVYLYYSESVKNVYLF